MMYTSCCFFSSILILACCYTSNGYQQGFKSMKMSGVETLKNIRPNTSATSSIPRRSFFSVTAASASVLLTINGPAAQAATPQILTSSGLGVKYAITEDVPPGSTKRRPQRGDIVAIEYTGYTSDGTVRESRLSLSRNCFVAIERCNSIMLTEATVIL